MSEFIPDKTRFKDSMGRYLTQSIFLEYQYDADVAIYSWGSEDKEYGGKVFPSLRKLYLEEADPTEYNFANKYLYDWEHWVRICNNAYLYKQIESWQEELEIKLRAAAVAKMLALDSNFNAIKWAADGHWNVRRGRPSRKEQEREKSIRQRAIDELGQDSDRILPFVKPKEADNG